MTERYEYSVDFSPKTYNFISSLRIGYLYEAKAHPISIPFTRNELRDYGKFWTWIQMVEKGLRFTNLINQ